MLKFFFTRYLNGFERTWGYDASYMRQVLAANPWSFLKFMLGTQAADRSAPRIVAGVPVCLCRDDEPGTHGPRRVSRQEIEAAFADDWTVESIKPTRFEVRRDLKGISFSEGGPKAWLVIARLQFSMRAANDH